MKAWIREHIGGYDEYAIMGHFMRYIIRPSPSLREELRQVWWRSPPPPPTRRRLGSCGPDGSAVADAHVGPTLIAQVPQVVEPARAGGRVLVAVQIRQGMCAPCPAQ